MKIISHKNDILTPRETEIVEHIPYGRSNWAIGRILGCSERTVSNHISSIFKKLNVSSRAHAVGMAIFKGIITIQMLFMAVILTTPENIDMKRGDRRISRRRLVITLIGNNVSIGSLYHIPRDATTLLLMNGSNIRKS